ncbi:MAG: CerR family C-terminal domain-containing protein [Gemmatales bacterium]|nr:CerR family C-terminal domain-containing protein [Gemmatales bacterium]MCS7159945.1 CerR family C-terminal domain-containing protein [Gemmatales bacterium]MDW8175144.1 CerR family C-terminal domain-containing protein [Gemmatales bacterium]MDW8221655.1 CerR family C-terminal domain-containing protein [Gemmatales bacterium]
MKQGVRNHLLEIAGRLFAERGYDGVTVREICHKAGVNVSAVNYYFGDKQNLYLEAVRVAARQRIEEVPMITWSADDPPAVKLRHYIRNLLQRVLLNGGADWQAQLIMSEVVKPTRACRRFVQEFVRPNFEVLLRLLRELVPEELSETGLYRVAFSIVGQCVYYRLCKGIVRNLAGKKLPSLVHLEQLAQHITEFSLAGIYTLIQRARQRRRRAQLMLESAS